MTDVSAEWWSVVAGAFGCTALLPTLAPGSDDAVVLGFNHHLTSCSLSVCTAGLPPLPAGIDPGVLPTLDALQDMLAAALPSSSTAATCTDATAAARAGVLQDMLEEVEQLPQSGAVAQLVSLLQLTGNGDADNIDEEEILDAYLVSDSMTPANQKLAFIRSVALLQVWFVADLSSVSQEVLQLGGRRPASAYKQMCTEPEQPRHIM